MPILVQYCTQASAHAYQMQKKFYISIITEVNLAVILFSFR